MENLIKIFGSIYLLLFLSGCLSIGSGPLKNSISVPSDQKNVRYILPRGFCLDSSSYGATGLQETLVITNCIAVNEGKQSYFSRRPVDTIVNITFTQSRPPKKISQQIYLESIFEKMEFKKVLQTSSNKKIIYEGKNLKKTFLYVDFQRISSSKSKEFVRKYFFLVNNKVTVMTIFSFRKPTKKTFVAFESFIKKLNQSNF